MKMSYQKRRYLRDPEFRNKLNAANKAYRERMNQHPAFRKLMAVRKRIVDIRDSYQSHSAKAEQRLAELEQLIVRRDELAIELRAVRAREKAVAA